MLFKLNESYVRLVKKTIQCYREVETMLIEANDCSSSRIRSFSCIHLLRWKNL
jgi:hypothetical protein